MTPLTVITPGSIQFKSLLFNTLDRLTPARTLPKYPLADTQRNTQRPCSDLVPQTRRPAGVGWRSGPVAPVRGRPAGVAGELCGWPKAVRDQIVLCAE